MPSMEQQGFFVNNFIITPENRNSEQARRYIRSRAAAAGHRNIERKPRKDSKQQTQTRFSTITSHNPKLPLPSRTHIQTNDPEQNEDEPPTLPLPHPLVSAPETSSTAYAYPVPFQPWYPALIDDLWSWMPTSWSHLTPPTTPEERRDGLTWVQQLTMTEPCYFYMNLLSCAERRQIQPERYVFLKAKVVETLQAAIDWGGSPSTGTIITVGRIALQEIMFGDREVGIKMHRPAQVTMVRMRGGLEAMQLPGISYKHVLWADRVMTKATGIEGLGKKGRYSMSDSRMLSVLAPELTNYEPERQDEG